MGRLLGNVEDQKYLGVGKHRVRVSGVEFSRSKNNDACVSYTFRDMAGATVQKKLSLKEAALWKLKTLICALGLPKEHVDVFDVDNLRHHERMVGKELWIELTPPAEGRKYPEFDTWWSVAGKTEQERQAAEGAKLAESLKNETAPSNHDDDDGVPF